MVTKFGSQFLATKFGFVPDCLGKFEEITPYIIRETGLSKSTL